MSGDIHAVLSIAIFAVVYGLIIVRNVKGIRFPIWATMSIGALMVLLLQIIPLDQAFNAINMDVILFLFGMFVLVSGLESSGMLKYVTIKVLEYAKTPNKILLFILVVLGILSAFLINDTVALVATPIVIGLATQMGIKPSPFLITLAFGVTIGSIMTPIGNPQNLLISIESQMPNPFLNFLVYLSAPAMVCMLTTYLILVKFYKKQIAFAVMPKISVSNELIADPVLAKISSIITISVVLGFFVLGILGLFEMDPKIPFSYIALGGGLLLLMISKQRRKILYEINWKIIVFFIAMFVFMSAMWIGGAIKIISSLFPILNPVDTTSSIFGIIITSTGLSQLMSNVPFAAVYVPIMHDAGLVGTNILPWLALASASTLAGNLTILGAASNIIILEAAEKKGIHAFSFWEFFKIGSVVTVCNMLILFAFLLVYSYI
ncbi:MAG: SLC13 family permease [Candidatus Nitrosotenuis sp.]